MIKWLGEANFPFVVIATKVDKISSTKKRKQLDKSLRIISDVAEVDFLPFSSATGQGRNELLNWIENVI